MSDKAIRAAKLTAAGMLDKARAKTAVTRAGGQIAPSKYLPNVPRQVHADGGKVAFMQGNHPLVPDVLYHGTARDIRSFDPDAKRSYDVDPSNPAEIDTGWFGKGHYFTASPKLAAHYADEGARRSGGEGANILSAHVAMKNPFVVDMKAYDSGATTLDKALTAAGVPVHPRGWRKPSEQTAALIAMGHDGVIATREGKPEEYVAFHPGQIKSALSATTFDPNDPDMTKKDGGRIRANKGGKMNEHGMYSKAAKLLRALPQERGTADQMIAAARLKETPEVKNFGPLPTGKISREDLARAFEARIPSVRVDQYGENPEYLSRQEQIERKAMRDNPHNIPMMPFEQRRLDELNARYNASIPINVETYEDDNGNEGPRDFQYEDYKTPGGQNYRERLLRLNQPDHPAVRLNQMIDYKKSQLAREIPAYGEDHYIVQDHQKRLQELIADRDRALREHGPIRDKTQSYQSNHWKGHPDVLAHIRMQDRTVGNKKLLHVEELQSDWAQEGRDQGFYDPEKPFQLYDWDKGRGISNHATEDEAVAAAQAISPDATVSVRRMNTGRPDSPPTGPYVQNTQHWTDLALKHVLREAALGNYDGIVFTPGQAQADRYGLEKHVDNLSYHPKTKTLMAMQGNRVVFNKDGMEPEEVAGHVGKEVSQKLLHPDALQKFEDGDQFYNLSGDDLKVGGQGMKGYYDNIVPKSVMKLAQMHDPAAAPGQPVPLKGDNGEEYQGFHLPMTDKMRQGILNEGFPAMKRGGFVLKASGGSVDAALAATRRFTKDGKAATMALKPKGK